MRIASAASHGHPHSRSGLRPAPPNAASTRTVRWAVLGLGHIVQIAILPAFAQAGGNSTLVALAHAGTFGDLRFFSSRFSMQAAPETFRSSRTLGGGALYDIGIDCINAARAVFAAEPTQVMAAAVTRRDQRFKEIPGTVAVVMQFPKERIASFTCSFGAADRSACGIVGTKGRITLGRPRAAAAQATFVVAPGDPSAGHSTPAAGRRGAPGHDVARLSPFRET